MDNLTHSLVGLAAAKAGLERLSPATTAACIVAANAPDLDFIAAIFGDHWTLLHHHRGITHSIVGILLLALLIPSLFWLGDLVIAGWRRQARTIRFRGLLVASLIVSATHPLMDWTNNYGVRPLLPWSGKWFYGDLVFIVDPFLWIVLGATAFLLTSRSKWQLGLWSLAASILSLLVAYAGVIKGALDHPLIVMTLWIALLVVVPIIRKSGYAHFAGRRVAFVGFGIVLAYWTGLAVLHSRAQTLASAEGAMLAAGNGETVTRLATMPTLSNPTHWLAVVESDRSLYRFELYLLDRSTSRTHKLVRFAKPDLLQKKVVALAERDRRAQILLEFARFPISRVVEDDCLTETLVQFADIRYTEPGRPRGTFSVEVPVECPNQP